MDPIAHTFAGSSLAAAGLRKTTPLAAAALILGANAPDVDVIAHFFGPYVALEWRRGITHGVPALVVLPFLVLGVLLLWDRVVRRRHDPGAKAIRPGILLALAALGTWTHPLLDWMNTYGMRWLAPFDGSWSYGDSLFIVDPWVWLLLGGSTFIVYSRTRPAQVGWGLLAGALSIPVLAGPAPWGAKAVWLAGLAGIVGLRAQLGGRRRGSSRRRAWARLALAAGVVYVAGMVAQAEAAESHVRTVLAQEGVTGIHEVMVSPEPANPFAGTVVVAVPELYLQGSFHWLRTPRFQGDLPAIARGEDGAVVEAASSHPEAERFLVWSRFPYFEVEERGEGYRIRIGDARYAPRNGPRGLSGLHVDLDRELRLLDAPLPEEPSDSPSAPWDDAWDELPDDTASPSLRPQGPATDGPEDPEDDLPNARELIERYVEVKGGRDVYFSVPGIRREGRVEVPGLGADARFITSQAPPSRMKTRTETPGVGEVLTGYDGEVAWSVDPLRGPRILEGEEAAQLREQAHLAGDLRDDSLAVEARTVARDAVDGEPCYLVEIRWRSGRETTDCYSEESGLLLRAELVQTTPVGTVDATVVYEDYGEFDGILLPTRTRQTVLGREQVMEVEEIRIEALDEEDLEPPEEVRELPRSPER